MSFDDSNHLRIVECGAAGVRIRIVDVATGVERTRSLRLDRPPSRFQEIEISATTHRVAASSWTDDPGIPRGFPRRSILLFDDGARLLREMVPKQPFERFSWLRDDRLAVLSYGQRADRESLSIYDQRGDEVRTFDLERSFFDPEIVSAGGPYVVLDEKRLARVLDADRGTVGTIPSGLGLVADGQSHVLVANGFDVRRFDLRTGKSDVVFHGQAVPEWLLQMQPANGF
jgi:hypothetical protein